MWSGAAIYALATTTTVERRNLTIIDSEFADNSAGAISGGGVYGDAITLRLEGTTFAGNSAIQSGGALFVINAVVSMGKSGGYSWAALFCVLFCFVLFCFVLFCSVLGSPLLSSPLLCSPTFLL